MNNTLSSTYSIYPMIIGHAVTMQLANWLENNIDDVASVLSEVDDPLLEIHNLIDHLKTQSSDYGDQLAQIAEREYANSKSFKSALKQSGTRARETLQGYMQTWLTQKLELGPWKSVVHGLPPDYSQGWPLPTKYSPSP